MSNCAVILIGSNINKEQNMMAGCEEIGRKCRILAISPFYETVAVGMDGAPNFLNACVIVETDLSAEFFDRDVLKPIEASLGRTRIANNKYTSRTFDADIILFNADVFTFGTHHIPDPDLLKFAHVAVPIADLIPSFPHPVTGEPLAAIAERLFAKTNTEIEAIWQSQLIVVDHVNESEWTILGEHMGAVGNKKDAPKSV